MAPITRKAATESIATYRAWSWKRSSRSFTLLELLVVVTILALVAGTVIFRWSSVQQDAVLAAAIERFESIDQHLRAFARERRRPCGLTLDLEHGRYRKIYDTTADEGPAWEAVGSGVAIAEVRVAGERERQRSSQISYDAAGVSPTFALRLDGPGARHSWLLFAGLSGQLIRYDSEDKWRDAQALAASPSL